MDIIDPNISGLCTLHGKQIPLIVCPACLADIRKLADQINHEYTIGIRAYQLIQAREAAKRECPSWLTCSWDGHLPHCRNCLRLDVRLVRLHDRLVLAGLTEAEQSLKEDI